MTDPFDTSIVTANETPPLNDFGRPTGASLAGADNVEWDRVPRRSQTRLLLRRIRLVVSDRRHDRGAQAHRGRPAGATETFPFQGDISYTTARRFNIAVTGDGTR